jgi:hypothetical protein
MSGQGQRADEAVNANEAETNEANEAEDGEANKADANDESKNPQHQDEAEVAKTARCGARQCGTKIT